MNYVVDLMRNSIKEGGVNISYMCKVMDVSPATVHRYIRGDSNLKQYEAFTKVVDFFGFEAEQVVRTLASLFDLQLSGGEVDQGVKIYGGLNKPVFTRVLSEIVTLTSTSPLDILRGGVSKRKYMAIVTGEVPEHRVLMNILNTCGASDYQKLTLLIAAYRDQYSKLSS